MRKNFIVYYTSDDDTLVPGLLNVVVCVYDVILWSLFPTSTILVYMHWCEALHPSSRFVIWQKYFKIDRQSKLRILDFIVMNLLCWEMPMLYQEFWILSSFVFICIYLLQKVSWPSFFSPTIIDFWYVSSMLMICIDDIHNNHIDILKYYFEL